MIENSHSFMFSHEFSKGSTEGRDGNCVLPPPARVKDHLALSCSYDEVADSDGLAEVLSKSCAKLKLAGGGRGSWPEAKFFCDRRKGGGQLEPSRSPSGPSW